MESLEKTEAPYKVKPIAFKDFTTEQYRGQNIMERFPKMHLVPTNLMDWKKPLVGIFIKRIFLIPILLSAIFCIFCVFSLYHYNQYKEDMWDDTYCTVTQTLAGTFPFHESYSCFKFNNRYYSNFNWDSNNDRIPSGDYIPNPKEWTAERSLYEYKKVVISAFFVSSAIGLVLFVIMHFIICGYSNRPKGTKKLREVADYCQRYSYWGIFRNRKTPKFVFFVKDNKFGLLDVAHYSVFLPANYDSLEWREKKKYLNAVITGRNYIIDIYGRELK